MNLLLPLAGLGLGVGLYVQQKKKHEAAKAAADAKTSAYVTASWSTPLSIADVQHVLNELGAQPPLAVDGVAGPKTVAEIKKFQSHAGIAVDGVVGPETTA